MTKYCLSTLLVFLSFICKAQDSLKSETVFEEYMNALVFEKFDFKKPDASYVLMDDSTGYQSQDGKTKIILLLVPGNYASALKEFRQKRSTKESILIDTVTHHIQGKHFFTLIEEQLAPTINGFENYVSIMTITSLMEGVTVGLVGAYPKSMDRVLRQKFIDAALTIRRR